MTVFLTIAFLQLLAVIAPGPDFALIIKNAILYPRKIALFSALGVALGIFVHTTYCILGLALVIANTNYLFNTVKVLGALYLIYIGSKSWVANDPNTPTYNVKSIHLTSWQALRQGFFCNVLNPKAGLFFLGLFSLVVKPGTSIILQFSYSLEMVLVTFTWFASLVLLMQHPKVQQRISRVQHYVMKILGVLLILFGIRLLFLTL